jgi:hypothetical protein
MLSLFGRVKPRRFALRCLAITVVLGASVGALSAPSNAAPSTGPSGVPSSSTAGGVGRTPPPATFGIGPANAKKLDGRPFLRYLASPGGALSDHVSVQNIGLKPVTLNVYVVDAVNGADGAIGYLPRASEQTGASRWVRVGIPGGLSRITIPGRSSKVLPVSMTVPSNATPGDHAAGIIASLISRVKSDTGQSVDFEQRVALRTFVRVSGELIAKLNIDKLHAKFDGATNVIGRGSVQVSYTVHNSGNVTLGGKQGIQIKGLLGATGNSPTVVDVPPLLPGGSAAVSVVVKHVMAEMLMTAKVTVKPLALAGDADPPLSDEVASTRFWAIPWIPLGTLILLILPGTWLLLARLRRGRKRAARHSGPRPKQLLEVKVPS